MKNQNSLPQVVKNIIQKIGLVVFGLILFLVLLELGLRLGGLIVMMPQEYRNRKLLKESGYRILCLGESTTMGSYPSYLSDTLNEYDPEIHFTVFNEGMGGTNSAMILSQLKENLDRYKPHMVIAMMGINDTPKTPKYEEEDIHVKSVFMIHNLRIYKLVMLLKEHIMYQLSQISFEYILKKIGHGIKRVPIEVEISQSDYAILGWRFLLDGNYEKAEEMLRKALKHDSHNDVVLTELGAVYFHWKKYEQAISCYTKALTINPNNDISYAGLSLCYNKQGKDDLAKDYLQKARTLRSQRYKPGTVYNYNRLKEIVFQRNLKLLCVQYPLRDVELLKQLIATHEGIIFVDNEGVFRETIEKASYEEYFRDNFAGDFGHCTEKGNQLLAHNVAQVIIDTCFSESREASK